MDYYAEPAFFVALVPIVVAACVLGCTGRRLFGLGCASSLIMIALLFFRSPAALIYAAGYLVFSLFVFETCRRRFKELGEGALPFWRVALACQLAPLVAYKVGVVVTPDFPGFLGISYITFKTVQVLIELRDGLIKDDDMTRAEYLYFLAFFPTFTSGPILRSRSFVADVRGTLSRDAYLERLYRGLGWFVLGVAYKFLFASLAQWALWFVPQAAGGGFVGWLLKTLFYGLDLFFDFAGYSAMAAGVGLALGVEVPRNFRAPYLATDIKEFWDRWHISLSTWLRDFVFMRFSRAAMEHKWFSDRNVTAAVGFMVNMTLMGLWHGITPAYVAYGLYHGALLACYHLYQQRCPFYKQHRRERGYKVCSWAVTMVAVFFGFALFAGYVPGLPA